jgi:L-fuculose-phosphate aldolase
MLENAKKLVLEIAKLVWERRLSDTAGGNISVREGDLACCTPRLMGYRLRWQITDADLSVVDLDGNVLEGPKEITREGKLHLALYKEFTEAHAVIHAHPYWTNVFVAKAKPIIPKLETTGKFGTIGCCEEAHGYSEELVESVLGHFRGKKSLWEKSPLMAIMPRHGIIAMGRDMNACFDIVDRIETECRCQILGKLLDL